MSSAEWLYLRIYPGGPSRLDLCLTRTVAMLVRRSSEIPGIDGWFFLRYFDFLGAHLRVRFRGSVRGVNALQREAERLLAAELPAIAAAKPAQLPRLIPLPDVANADAHVGFATDMYEPEADKFGDEAAVVIAERVFTVSSEIALEMIAASPTPTVAVRATAALLLMIDAVEEAIPPERREAFWSRYIDHWTGPLGDFGSQLEAASERRMDIAESRCAEASREPRVQEWRRRYRQALAGALADARALGRAAPAEELCFHFVHLLNNRVGLLPLEEAYLACFARKL